MKNNKKKVVTKLESQLKRVNMTIKGIIESKNHIKQWERSDKKNKKNFPELKETFQNIKLQIQSPLVYSTMDKKNIHTKENYYEISEHHGQTKDSKNFKRKTVT